MDRDRDKDQENGRVIVQRLVDAANARDWDALLAVCGDDVSLIHPLAAVPYRGREGVRAFFVASAEALPDQFLHVDAVLAAGDVAALEGRITATEDDEPTVTPCAFFFTLRAGQVRQVRMYYDTATMGEDR